MTEAILRYDEAVAEAERLEFERPGPRAWVRVGAAATRATVFVNGQEAGTHLGAWTPFELEITPLLRERNELEVRCEPVDHLTNGFLPEIGITWCGARDVEVVTAPRPPRPPAPQRSAVRGGELLVDGRPFRVRGILHWGYYPELGHPWPSEAQMRREIDDLQARGFNLIKFCLWIPPPRYYELCDERGMLVWQEYPVWRRPLRPTPEFEEFFRLDGPHPCVILRTLTCENDDVAAGEIVALAREMIPGCVVLDNSAWRCAEHAGDFWDEHIYLHNAQWRYYGARMANVRDRPLLLGESMAVDSVDAASHAVAVAVRRYQIESLDRRVGYVVTALRDIDGAPLGLFTRTGAPKDEPRDWAWHGRDDAPRAIPEPDGPVPGPRKGAWKCAEHTWWSPVIEVLDDDLPADLIRREACFELLTGRVLTHAQGTRVLVQLHDVHNADARHPLVIEFFTEGERRVVSALRTDTEAGRRVQAILDLRAGPAPEIGPLLGDSIVLEEWEMRVDGASDWIRVRCDTPLVNRGRNVFEGWATFRTAFEHPGGARTLRCEAVGDYYEIAIDRVGVGEAGNRTGTWDGTRDRPREFSVDLDPGRHEIVFRVRDWRAAGGMVGPVFFATDLSQRVF